MTRFFSERPILGQNSVSPGRFWAGFGAFSLFLRFLNIYLPMNSFFLPKNPSVTLDAPMVEVVVCSPEPKRGHVQWFQSSRRQWYNYWGEVKVFHIFRGYGFFVSHLPKRISRHCGDGRDHLALGEIEPRARIASHRLLLYSESAVVFLPTHPGRYFRAGFANSRAGVGGEWRMVVGVLAGLRDAALGRWGKRYIYIIFDEINSALSF